METYLRKLNSEEIEKLHSELTNIWKLAFGIILKWFFISVLTLYPCFFIIRLSETERLLYIVSDQLLIITLILNFSKPIEKLRKNKKIKKATHEVALAEVTRIKAIKAIVRPDYNNISHGYYLDIGNGKTIFLQNEHFEILYFQKKFPTTYLELIKTAANKIYINTITTGALLFPEKEIVPFSKEQYKTGDVHKDGQVLEIPIENIN